MRSSSRERSPSQRYVTSKEELMFRNYLAAALRNLLRNRLYAAINVVGLAVGLTAAVLLLLFVRDEFSYDKWIPGYERIYKVSGTMATSKNTVRLDRAPYIAAALLKQDYAQVEDVARFAPDARSLRRNDVEFTETINWADPNLFSVLPLQAIAGNLATALQEPDSLVLTRSTARKYFGDEDPIGQTLEVGRKGVMKVTAILEDLPSNTHLTMDVIGVSRNTALSVLAAIDSRPSAAGFMGNVNTYLRLASGYPGEQLRRDLPAFIQRHPRFTGPDVAYTVELSPLAAVHLHPLGNGALKPPGSAATAYSALLLAILIVAIAGINFINLTTARAVRRAVEVGIRKASGAERRQLIAQFICESIFYAALSMAVAMGSVELLLPSFNGFLQRTIVFDYGRDPALMGALLAFVMTVGVLGGTYPAFVLSRFAPAAVLKGGAVGRLKGGRGRQVLVASQFAVLIVLALVSTAIYRQVHYAMNEALRFDKDQVLTIPITTALGDIAPPVRCDIAFATEVRALPGVRSAVCSSGSILTPGIPGNVVGPAGVAASSNQLIVDFGFFEFFGLKPAAGRFFARDFGGDAMSADGKSTALPAVVINETLSRALGFATPATAVGQTVKWRPRLPVLRGFAEVAKAQADGASEIVGVVPDFAQGSVREGIPPGIFWIDPSGYSVLNVKLVSDQIPETLAAIDRAWKRSDPQRPIIRRFLDQAVQNLYGDVTRLTQTVATFAAVAVFIACLGLFGLAAFVAEQRTKEMGVRKALGASSNDILRLMLWEFSRPVIWASLVSWPVAYFAMRYWLDGFADRVDIGLWTFPAATVLALVIAVLTVGGHALLVARAAPVTSLRYE
jgi:putative ABC transport system permease protein